MNDTVQNLHQKYGSMTKAELEASPVQASVTGKIASIRDFGKGAFIQVKDSTGAVLLYVAKEKLGDDAYLKMAVGDALVVGGNLFRTVANELAVEVTNLI